MKNAVFWDVAPCRSCANRRFEGTYRPHLQSRKIRDSSTLKMEGEDVYIHIFLTSALAGGEWLASRSCRFTSGERTADILWIGCWVDLRTGLDDVDKRKFLALPGLELRPLSRPARSH
jgi:hypothetical protein